MEIKDNGTKVYFGKNIFYEINDTWWRVKEITETYNTGSQYITVIVPKILEEIEGGMDEINKRYYRSKKMNRLIE